jgi:hypothetical protein
MPDRPGLAPERGSCLSSACPAPMDKSTVTDYTLMLADSHSLVRQGIRNIIDAAADLKIVGQAACGHRLVQRCDPI